MDRVRTEGARLLGLHTPLTDRVVIVATCDVCKATVFPDSVNEGVYVHNRKMLFTTSFLALLREAEVRGTYLSSAIGTHG
jgi:hypothetical protein